MKTEDNVYDVVIIGGGPAGLSCAIYATRYKLKTLILSKIFGGEILDSPDVENYPGFSKISGFELMDKFLEQAKHFGAETIETSVSDVKRKDDDTFEIIDENNNTYRAKAILLATGSNRRKLGVKGEEAFKGKGVSYCATCDAAFFKDKTVAIIGGGNSAAVSVMVLSDFAKKVYMIYRKSRDNIRAEPYKIDQIEKNPKCELILETNLIEIYGDKKVQGLKLDKEYKGSKDLPLDGVFIDIGFDPNNIISDVTTDKEGYVIVKTDQSTNIPGIYAAGDLTTGTHMFKQVITAAAEGAIAAESMHKYLKDKKNK